MVRGHDPVAEILAYARDRQVGRILVGKPRRPAWRQRLDGSVAGRLVQRSRDFDVQILRPVETPVAAREEPPSPAPHRRRPYIGTTLLIGAVPLVAFPVSPAFGQANLVMLYLLGSVIRAVFFGRAPAIHASVLSVFAFDVFFVPPATSFGLRDTPYLFPLATPTGGSSWTVS
jgi:two-component system sensor histidine kinase KdpD